MIERREFISICRQIGTMMEVGVDFLRITAALRSQTDNPRLIQLYDQLDEDLRAGDSLSDAMSHAPDVFSPFAVSLVRQGEARGDIESAWARIADFYKTEAREDIELGDEAGLLEPIGARFQGRSSGGRARLTPYSGLPLFTQKVAAHSFLGLAVLLSLLGVVRALVEGQLLAQRFELLADFGVVALFFAGVGGMATLRDTQAKERENHCVFCGREASEEVLLSYSAYDNTAICGECAAQIVAETPRTREQRAQDERERNRVLRDVADALPTGEESVLEDTIVLDDDDPLSPAHNNDNRTNSR